MMNSYTPSYIHIVVPNYELSMKKPFPKTPRLLLSSSNNPIVPNLEDLASKKDTRNNYSMTTTTTTAHKPFVATTKRIALPTSMEIDLVVEETNILTGELQDRTITVVVALPKAWTSTSSTTSAASLAVPPPPPPTLKAFNVRFIHPVSRPRSPTQQQQQQQHQQTQYLQQLQQQQQQQQRVQHMKQPIKRKNRTLSSWPLPKLHSKLPSSPSLITRCLPDRCPRTQSQPPPHQEKTTSQRPPGRAVFLPPTKKLKTTMRGFVPDDDDFITRNQKIINSILDQPEQNQKQQLQQQQQQQQQKSHLDQHPQHPTTQCVGTTPPNALYYPNHPYPAAIPLYRNTNTKHHTSSSTIVVDGRGAPVSFPPTKTGTSTSRMLPFSLSVSSLPTSITDDIDIVASLLALPHQPPPAARVSQCSSVSSTPSTF